MTRISYNIGMGISSILEEKNISEEEAGKLVNLSFRDFRRIIEGKLFVSPKTLDEISQALGTTSERLISYKPNGKRVPGLEYNKEFSSEEHLYTIIDLLDEYIELKEQM